MTRLLEAIREKRVIIGVVHLPPLPGSPRWRGEAIEELVERAVRDAKSLVEGGVDGVIVENYGDAPFEKRVSRPETIAAYAIILRRVVKEVGGVVPVGASLLRNSGPEAVAVAAVAGAEFIRVNALCEPRVAPEGILEPVAREVAEKARSLAWRGAVLADVDVKHSLPLGEGYDPGIAAREALGRCGADAVVVSGSRTGEAPEPGYVAVIRSAVPSAPLILGSGVTPENIRLYWRLVNGFIIGTYFKEGGVTRNPVDPARVKRLVSLARSLEARG